MLTARCVRLLTCSVCSPSSLWCNHCANVNFSPVAFLFSLGRSPSSSHGSGLVVTNFFHLLFLFLFLCLQFWKVVLLGQTVWVGVCVLSLVWASLTFKAYTADSAVILTAHISMGVGPSPLQHPLSFPGSVPLVFWWCVVWGSVWGYLCSNCLIHLDATCLELETFLPWFYSKFYYSKTCPLTLHTHHEPTDPACLPPCTLTTLHVHHEPTDPARSPPCTLTMVFLKTDHVPGLWPNSFLPALIIYLPLAKV